MSTKFQWMYLNHEGSVKITQIKGNSYVCGRITGVPTATSSSEGLQNLLCIKKLSGMHEHGWRTIPCDFLFFSGSPYLPMSCVENTKQAGYHSFLVQPPLLMTEKMYDTVRMFWFPAWVSFGRPFSVSTDCISVCGLWNTSCRIFMTAHAAQLSSKLIT